MNPAPAARERDVIFVVGMGRSGSSALARVLSLCGGALPLDVIPPNFANRSGYWEPARAIQLNDAFLEAHGSSWYDGSLTLQTGLVGAGERGDFCAAIAAFLQTGFEEQGAIVLKEPRISGLLPYWMTAVKAIGANIKIVHLFRDPVEVAASLEARDGLAAPHAYALWLKYNLIAERDARIAPRVFVSYEALMQDWRRVVLRCTSQLELDLAIGPATARSVASFLSPALRHHHARDRANDEILPEPWVRATYAALRDGEAGGSSATAFDAIRSDYVRARHATEYRVVCPI